MNRTLSITGHKISLDAIDRGVQRGHALRAEAFRSALGWIYRQFTARSEEKRPLTSFANRDCTSSA